LIKTQIYSETWIQTRRNFTPMVLATAAKFRCFDYSNSVQVEAIHIFLMSFLSREKEYSFACEIYSVTKILHRFEMRI